MPIGWLEHGGHEVLVVEVFPTDTEADMLETLARTGEQVLDRPPGTVRTLLDVHGAVPTPSFASVAKRLNRDVMGPRGVTMAITGLTPLARRVHNGLSAVGGGFRMQAVPTREKGLEYLTRG